MTLPAGTQAIVDAARDLVEYVDEDPDAPLMGPLGALVDAIDAVRVSAPAVTVEEVDPLEEVVRRAAALVAYAERGGRIVGPALAIKLDEALADWANPI